MILGKICGTIVCTRKDDRLKGMKFLILEELEINSQKPTGNHHIAVDAVGAGAAETVLMVSGSSARLTERTLNCPVDAAICGIVDEITIDAKKI